jgi:drug/metabolite transporter (DMT)-like permease
MVLVDWFWPGGSRPAPRLLAGLVLGFAGMALLVGPKHLGGAERVNPLGAFALVLASLARISHTKLKKAVASWHNSFV